MQTDSIYKRRTVFPNWRSLRNTPSYELHSAKKAVGNGLISGSQSVELEKRWETSKKPEVAVELVEAAQLFGLTETSRQAAKSLLSSDLRIPAPLKATCEQLLFGGSQHIKSLSMLNAPATVVAEEIRQRKLWVHENPRDAISAIELARLHTILGQTNRAQYYVNWATRSSPHNRYVVRSAIRFFSHTDELDFAFLVLKKCAARKTDPLIRSADIAIRDIMGKPPDISMREIKFLAADKTPLLQRSELLSALGTLEINAGSGKVAKKLLVNSLIAPSDNSIAQALWLEDQYQNLELGGLSAAISSHGFEALFFRAVAEKNISTAISAARYWQLDEPYSVKPAISGSFYASLHNEQFPLALQFLEIGLQANPGSIGLLNNKLVTLAKMGELSEAKAILATLEQYKHRPSFRPNYLAARGLLAFCEGNGVDGRNYYFEANEAALSEGDARKAALAEIYWFECETKNQSMSADEYYAFCKKIDRDVAEIAKKDTTNLGVIWSNVKSRARRRSQIYQPSLLVESIGNMAAVPQKRIA